MKTAISIPDSVFQAAENLANRLGVSRSELYTRAVSEYIKSNRYQDVTKQLNDVYADTESTLDKQLHRMQLDSLPREDW